MAEPLLRAGHIHVHAVNMPISDAISDASTKCTQTLPLKEVPQYNVSNEVKQSKFAGHRPSLTRIPRCS